MSTRLVLACVVSAGFAGAQQPVVGGAAAMFDVASVRQDTSDVASSVNVPLTRGDFYPPNGGHLVARNIPLLNFVAFAYDLTSFQEKLAGASLPGWAREERFDVEARFAPSATKAQVRAMMRGLLEDRFHLRTREEQRQMPVFALEAVHPGKAGPELKPQPENDPACAEPGKGPPCGALGAMPASVAGRRRVIGHEVRLPALAEALAGFGNLDRPVEDGTGLGGKYDFSLEWKPEPPVGAAPADADAVDPSFGEALREQLGLKLVARKGAVRVVVVEGVERLEAN